MILKSRTCLEVIRGIKKKSILVCFYAWIVTYVDSRTKSSCTWSFRFSSRVVQDSSAVWRLFVRLAGAVGRQSTLHKENSGFAAQTPGRHISTFRGYQILFSIRNSLYKSLHQSFFYSFITILPSESGVTLDYCTIFPYTLSFLHFTFTFEPTNVISRY